MSKGVAGMLKQAQKLQARIAQVQEELADKRVEGTAGGGMVTVVANGLQDILEVKIDPEVVDPEDVEMLEDLIVAAIKQARERAQELSEEEMSKATRGLLPQFGGGLKVPGLGM